MDRLVQLGGKGHGLHQLGCANWVHSQRALQLKQPISLTTGLELLEPPGKLALLSDAREKCCRITFCDVAVIPRGSSSQGFACAALLVELLRQVFSIP